MRETHLRTEGGEGFDFTATASAEAAAAAAELQKVLLRGRLLGLGRRNETAAFEADMAVAERKRENEACRRGKVRSRRDIFGNEIVAKRGKG